MREHHSFVELPPPGYKPRAYDPALELLRHLVPGLRDADQRADRPALDRPPPAGQEGSGRGGQRAGRSRSSTTSTAARPSRSVSALLDGARWWNEAFEAAGYRNAFRVELMPEGADPMDLRYNVIQWVHRATRGWSYGAAVIDPRTGEIIKGHVTLGSLRVRQDYLIAEALLAPYDKGKPPSRRPQELALARLRQLAAHEVGHTLGLDAQLRGQHGRPRVGDGLSAAGGHARRRRLARHLVGAYATGIGEWDKVSITWGYRDHPRGTDERAAGDQDPAAPRSPPGSAS